MVDDWGDKVEGAMPEILVSCSASPAYCGRMALALGEGSL